MIDLFVVWTPGTVMSTTLGGLLLGLLLVARFDNPRFTALESIAVTGLILGVVEAVFWSGQFVDVYISDGSGLADRVASRFLLSMVFVACVAVGTGIGVRRARGGWRK